MEAGQSPRSSRARCTISSESAVPMPLRQLGQEGGALAYLQPGNDTCLQ